VNATAEAGLYGVGGQFLSWGDYDNDGDLDLLVNGARLFSNNGAPNWDFTEVSGTVGISGGSYGTWADWNNDGFLDIYTAGSDKLYRNNGPPNWDFTDVTASSNILKESHSTGCGWGDYDNDGDVDLFKIRGEDWNDGDPIYFPNSFWRNEGDGTFTNVTVAAGVDESSNPKYSRGVAWADYNDDSLLDIYISNYRQQENYLYENNGDGTFTDVAPQKGVHDAPSGQGNPDPYSRAGHGVGSIWGDYDNDGYLDLWITNLNHKDIARTSDDSLLMHNNGPPDFTFTNMRESSGIPVKRIGGGGGTGPDGDELFVGCAWGDYDNDGDLDLYLPQIYDIDYAYSFLYENNGDGTFSDVTDEAQVRVWDTYAGCWADYDNDGDMDLITSGRDSGGNGDPHFVHLFRNEGPQGNWLHINLKGDGVYSNSAAIGARVIITTDTGFIQVKEVEGGTGPHGHQNSLTLQFGFGVYTGTVDIEIRWPNNKVQFMEDVTLNQVMTIMDETAGDLIILDTWFDNQNPINGEIVRLSCEVENVGSTTINTAEVKYYLDTISDPTQINPTATISDLVPGEQAQTYVDWDTSGVSGFHNIYVKAVIVDPPPETTSNIMSNPIYIRAENALPIASLYASPTTLDRGNSVFFDGSNSTDDTNVMEYYFDYGNGQNSGWITQPTITYTYETGGDFNSSLRVRDDDNGISQNNPIILIEVKSKPYANLFVSTPDVFKGEIVALDGSGSFDEGGTIEEYYFDFGDGDNSGWITEDSVNHTYGQVGQYTTSLIVKDDDGEICESPAEVIVTISARPIASLSAAPTLIYKGEGVTFDASLSSDEDGTVDEYHFEYGNGENSGWVTDPIISYNYSVAGLFMASLIVRDNDMVESENLQEMQIEVRAIPLAVLTTDQTTIYKDDSILFDAIQSSDEGGSVEQYLFDFGDGYTSGWILDPTHEHSYSAAGVFNATLSVRDNDGDTNENIAYVIISVRSYPYPDLSVTSTEIFKGDNITLDGSGSWDEGGMIQEYFFDFGDGATSGWVTEFTFNHLYDEVGEFTAVLLVRDDEGDVSQEGAIVDIKVLAKPIASLESSITVIHRGESVVFNASSSQDEDGNIIRYNFDFGDGSSSGWITQSLFEHTYNSYGVFDVTLLVMDNDEFICDTPDTLKIEVRSYPKAVISCDNTSVEEGETILFDGSKSQDRDGTIMLYLFDFGDGKDTDWISQSNVEHTYLNAGTYTVSLKVMDDHDDESTNKATLKITIEIPNIRPVGQIIDITPQPVSSGREVAFIGSSYDEDGRVVSYLWSSNLDGELSNEESFFTSSLSWGIHTISLTVQDDAGDWSQEDFRVIFIKEENEIPQVIITYPENEKRFKDTLTITGSSEDPDGSIETIEIQIDFGPWEEIEVDDMWSHEINLTDFSKGEHTIAIRAYDGEDYSEEEYLTFFVGEEDEGPDMIWIFTLVFLVILVVIVVAIIIGRAYKKNPPEMVPIQAQVTKVPRTFEPAKENKEITETRINW
jgi:hypothetical protein